MGEDTDRRFVELWEAIKQIERASERLEVGAGKFVLIPPGEVRLSGFRARLTADDEASREVELVADLVSAVTTLRLPGDSYELKREFVPLDLHEGYVLDGVAFKNATELAGALLARMTALLEPKPSSTPTSSQPDASAHPSSPAAQKSSRER